MKPSAEPNEAGRHKLKCRLCGVESDYEDGFVMRGSVVHGPHHVCVTCFQFRKNYGRHFLSWLWQGAILVVIGYVATESIGEAVPFAVAAYAFTYIAIVLHELGHVLAAAAVGVQVAAMSFGGGPRARILRIRGTFVIFSPFPSEGLTIPVHATAKHFRWKQAVIVIAGPVVNAICAVAGIYLLVKSADFGFQEYARIGMALWAGINIWLAIANLRPFTVRTAYGEQPSDGAQLRALPSMTDERIDKILRARQLTLALLEYQFGSMNAALTIIEDELKRDDPPPYTRSLVTAGLAETGQLQRGVDLGREYLGCKEVTPLEKATLQNNLAYTLFLTGDPTHLEEADRLSLLAMQTLPMLLPIRSTRGAILIARGCYQEGLDILSDKRFRMEAPRHRASVASMRAMGLARLGELEHAVAALKLAVSLDPANHHLAAVREAIAAAARP